MLTLTFINFFSNFSMLGLKRAKKTFNNFKTIIFAEYFQKTSSKTNSKSPTQHFICEERNNLQGSQPFLA